MTSDFNNKIRQVLFLVFVLALVLLLVLELYQFFPGFLGAITLYIICRDRNLKLVNEKHWKPGFAALMFITLFLVCIGIPIYFAIDILSSRIITAINNQQQVVTGLKSISDQVYKWTGQELFTDPNIQNIQKKAADLIPSFLNSTLMILTNVVMMLFLSYFMFTCSASMEKKIQDFIPLRTKNIDMLAAETKNMIKANAIGIPLISIIQGLFALFGYWIFGVKDYVLWGFMTGIFAFFPVVGTMLIWVPLVVYVYSTGNSFNGTGLLIYSLIVTGNVDYLARITLLKKIGNVHPITTVLGVIVGLQLFGFLGFIFGPLLISYSLLLIKIYSNEFGSMK
ncbi:MAG: AI-2E family transporter [Bacteroidota bacterium]